MPPVEALCYFRHPKESWVWGKVTGVNEKKKMVTLKAVDDAGNPRADPGKVPPPLDKGPWAGGWPPPVPPESAEVPDNDDNVFQVREDIVYGDEYDNTHDLLRLTILHDSTLLSCIKRRYFGDIIYTFIGAIVVAVNPFNYKIPWYEDTPENMDKYLAEGYPIQKNLPHSWACAHNTYHELLADFRNQTILVSGESGAGKTEASKIVLKYLGVISQRMGGAGEKEEGLDIQAKIMAASPFLEAFGNAKTSRNDNSSRFGKFMTIKFSDSGKVLGANITKYLLEKSRIVTAGPGERCYHSFYLAVRGNGKPMGPTTLKSDKNFVSINAGGVVNNNEFDSYDEFKEVSDSMTKIGITNEEITGIWSVLAGVLHSLNIVFDKAGEGSEVSAKSKDQVATAAQCFGIDTEYYRTELIRNIIEVKGEKSEKKLPPSKALDGRDAFVKRLYDQIFSWLVVKCNENLDVPECQGWIGLLDIFGFEQFEVNSFEQLCINTANEALQGNYNHHVFAKDMDECRAEGVDVTQVEFPDNTPCINLICSSKPMGIFSHLDAASKLSKGDPKEDIKWLDDLVEAFDKKHKYFEKKRLARDSFIVKHYAGDVSYTVTDFVSKNADTLKADWHHVVASSKTKFVTELNWEVGGKALTVAGFFKRQLDELMDIINNSNPHWIRCVKPHPAKKKMLFDGNSVCFQLTTSGVLATVAIRKAGYPVRLLFADFVKRYRVMFWDHPDPPKDVKAASEELLKVMGFDKTMGQMGTKRVFLKQSAYVDFEDRKREASAAVATRCQAFIRSKLTLINEWRPRLWARSAEAIQAEVRCFLEKSRDIRRERADWRRRVEEETKEGLARNGVAEEEDRAREGLLQDLGRYSVWVYKVQEEIRAESRSLGMEETRAREVEEGYEQEAREQINLKMRWAVDFKEVLEVELQETRVRRTVEQEIFQLWLKLLAVWIPMQLFELECGRGFSERMQRRRIVDEEWEMRNTLRMFETEGMAFVSVFVAQDDEEKERNDILYEQIVAFQNIRRAEITASKRVLMESTLSILRGGAGGRSSAQPRSPTARSAGGQWTPTAGRSPASFPNARSPRGVPALAHDAGDASPQALRSPKQRGSLGGSGAGSYLGSPLSQPRSPNRSFASGTPTRLPQSLAARAQERPASFEAALEDIQRQETEPLDAIGYPLHVQHTAHYETGSVVSDSSAARDVGMQACSLTSPTGRYPTSTRSFAPITQVGRYGSGPAPGAYTSIHAAGGTYVSNASIMSVGSAGTGPGARYTTSPTVAPVGTSPFYAHVAHPASGRHSPANSHSAAAVGASSYDSLVALHQRSTQSSPVQPYGHPHATPPLSPAVRSPLKAASAKAKGWWDD